MNDCVDLGVRYMDAKEFVIRAGYAAEVDWQCEVNFDFVTETHFLREAAWVVLSCGFREANVRRCFAGVSDAFLGWCDARRIAARREVCEERAVTVFGNQRKIRAIGKIVSTVAEDGIERIKGRVRDRGSAYLRELPYMGPVTSYHLAKNLGVATVKPDRHLARMARMTGYGSPLEMCLRVAATVGDSVDVVDVVLWRYATLRPDYGVFGRGDVGDGELGRREELGRTELVADHTDGDRGRAGNEMGVRWG